MADVRLNGEMRGSQLAKFARQLFPNIKVIITSGKDWRLLPKARSFCASRGSRST